MNFAEKKDFINYYKRCKCIHISICKGYRFCDRIGQEVIRDQSNNK